MLETSEGKYLRELRHATTYECEYKGVVECCTTKNGSKELYLVVVISK